MGKGGWQAALRRAPRAAKAEGMILTRFEIEPTTGKITVVAGTTEGAGSSVAFDLWMAKHARAWRTRARSWRHTTCTSLSS